MQKQFSPETESDLTKLGLYQVAGGAVGILILIWSFFRGESISTFTILFAILVSLFFGYSIFCGILCINAKDNSLRFSLVNQFLQLIAFAVFGYAFKYVSGVYLTIGLDLTESLKFTFGAGISKFEININSVPDIIRLDLNLVALLIILWIDKLMKRARLEREIRQIEEIGQS